jgi:hypothetical protein
MDIYSQELALIVTLPSDVCVSVSDFAKRCVCDVCMHTYVYIGRRELLDSDEMHTRCVAGKWLLLPRPGHT